MHIALMLLAVLAFGVLLFTAILTGFDIIPWGTGAGVTLAAFLLGALSVALVFHRLSDANGD